jgi:hypothetical protein
MSQVLVNILKSHDVKIVFSVIWGLGLASLFRRVCKGRNCIIYRAPAINEIQGKTFGFNNKCYNYAPRLVTCGEDKSILVSPEEFKCIN